MSDLQEKIKSILNDLNSKGIKIPMIQDPVTGLPSVTLTFTVISFNVALLGLLGKVANLVEGINVDQAINLFLVSSGLYLTRKITGKNITTEKDKE